MKAVYREVYRGREGRYNSGEESPLPAAAEHNR
jgi:hypothetical protein